MAIAITDKRLRDGLHAALDRIGGLTLTGQAAATRDLVVGILEGALSALDAAIAKEDAEEVGEIEARAKVHATRAALDEAFTQLYLGLHSGVLARRLAGDAGAAVQELTHYLEAQSPSGFRALGLDLAIATVERAHGFAERFLPDAVRDSVLEFSTAALEDAKGARERLRKEGVEATQALAELERARGVASAGYLAARDLISGALRLAGQHDKLSSVMPGLREVIDAPSGGAEVPAPTPVDA